MDISEGKASAGVANVGEDSEGVRLIGVGASEGRCHPYKGRARSSGGNYC
jgi:hypothetical protein